MTSPGREQSGEPQWWDAPWQFAVHAVVGLLIFTVIAGAAVALDVFVRTLESHGMNGVIAWGLRVAEYALFLADLLLFLVFIFRTARSTLRKL
jgi:hypothetical protein